MSLAVIDAREWQNLFDLETGRKASDDSPAVSMVKEVLGRHPYPGDTETDANQWVTDTALDIIDGYGPQLVCLSYASQVFVNRHFDQKPARRQAINDAAVAEAFRFVEKSGFVPVIVGTGPLVPLKGDIDLSGLDGLAISSNWSARYCGVHRPSDSDMAHLKRLQGVERVVTTGEWVRVFQSAEPDLTLYEDEKLMPDILVVAKEGYAFKTMGTTLRKPVNIPAVNFSVPVYTPLGPVADIREIKDLVLKSLEKQRTALIIVEGVGQSSFPADCFLCRNHAGWFCHEGGDSFYLTMSTGQHRPFDYPAGYRYFAQDEENGKFPFSGYMNRIPEDTLGRHYRGKSAAVGNRSMFMHMVFGVDIAVECFARNLFNQGILGVVHNKEKYDKI